VRRRNASTDQGLPAWYLEAIARRDEPESQRSADRGPVAATKKRRVRQAGSMGVLGLSLFAQATQFAFDRNVWGAVGCAALAALASWAVVAIVRRPIIDMSR
jgi:hypothetical protein